MTTLTCLKHNNAPHIKGIFVVFSVSHAKVMLCGIGILKCSFWFLVAEYFLLLLLLKNCLVSMSGAFKDIACMMLA